MNNTFKSRPGYPPILSVDNGSIADKRSFKHSVSPNRVASNTAVLRRFKHRQVKTNSSKICRATFDSANTVALSSPGAVSHRLMGPCIKLSIHQLDRARARHQPSPVPRKRFAVQFA